MHKPEHKKHKDQRRFCCLRSRECHPSGLLRKVIRALPRASYSPCAFLVSLVANPPFFSDLIA